MLNAANTAVAKSKVCPIFLSSDITQDMLALALSLTIQRYGYIALTNGNVAIVDPEDYERFCGYTYHLSVEGYVVRWIAGGRRALLHREIMKAPDDMEIDHRDGNRSDNRKINLRICTSLENSWNVGLRSNNTSGYTGVYWVNADTWTAEIMVRGERIRLGRFREKESAARVRRASELLYYGAYAPKREGCA